MGGSARFLMLLTSPYFPLLTPRPSFLRLARNSRLLTPRLPSSNLSFYSTRSLISFAPIRAVQSESFHSQSGAFKDETFTDQFGSGGGSAPNWYHPWPEWSRFIDYVRQGGYFERVDYAAVDGDVLGFTAGDNFSSQEFFKAALACLEFARDRDNLLGYLSRSDIRVVVENGSAYLFRDAEMLRSRMKSFLGIADSGVVNLDRPTMVDLMKFLISSANIRPVPSAISYHSNEQTVVASVRNLLSELANLNFAATYPGSGQSNYSDRYGQAPRPRGQQIEMKRGDWICPKCTFMNFARNTKCLECEEARPRRQLTNGEWECPQCDFFNYGRNMVCLRCDCKRPGEVTLSPANLQSTNGNTSDTGFQQAANEKAQWWSGNGSQLNNSADPNPKVDEQFPEIMPLRKGVNRFVVSTRKTPLERRLANAKAQRDLGNEDASGGINNSNNHVHVPFVPLPPDMFSSKPQNDVKEIGQWQNNASHTSQGSTSPGSSFVTNEPDRTSEKLHISERPNSLTESRDDNEQAEKSERWFKRVSELHDINDLASAIPDEDFPELMPMHKEENRFVVSKKKDRSLTTPMNKRRAAVEQPSDSKFVPFVPFPPGYFAKQDQSQSEAQKSSQQSADETHSSYNVSGMSSYGDTKTSPDGSNRSPTLENSPQSNMGTDKLNNDNTWSSIKTSGNGAHDFNVGYSGRSPSNQTGNQTDITTNSCGDSQKEKTPLKDSWSGKSLEGSAVTEIDPLDMSEEAKAERWFRRAAQIKDISELSQIPDEDFPSIMPMRKGVNRFVVSKRKTPLERRLSSPQYRRNLPVVESDPQKTSNESN